MLWVRLLLIALLSWLAIWLIISAIRAVRSGEANAGGVRVVYHVRPVFFITTVFTQFGFGFLMFYIVFKILFAMTGQ